MTARKSGKPAPRRELPRQERAFALAKSAYTPHRTASGQAYLRRRDRVFYFAGSGPRILRADLKAVWREKYPGEAPPSDRDLNSIVDELRLLAEEAEADEPTERERAAAIVGAHVDEGDAEPYYIEDGCTWWRRDTPNGPVPTMLATFEADIPEEVTLDDGAERTLTWLVRVTASDERTGEVRITPDQLGRPQQWAAKAAGTSALVMPGMAIADHLRVAVQSRSAPARSVVYTHTGWRHLDGRWVYLTSSGALGGAGMDGSVTVDLGTLGGFALPAETDETSLRKGIRASLALLGVAPDPVIILILAAAYRAPLPLPPDCTVWAFGRSGTFKTALTSLAQQHFGPTMDAYNLPGNWTSTANALVQQAHTLDGALFTVDDYSPDVTKIDAQRRAAAADRLMRGSANRAGRGRLRPDGTHRPDRPPRAQILASAEDLPPSIESLLARVLITEVTPGAVKVAGLSRAQGAAADGQFATAMAGYIRHLAARYDAEDDLPAALTAVRAQLRDQARSEKQHARVALNVASLALGWLEFLPFAAQAGAITTGERDALWARSWKALCDVGAEQERYRRDSDPVSVYLRALGALVASGRAHMAGPQGGCPVQDARRWGWAEGMAGGEIVWRPGGDLIGWIQGDDVYLDPETAFRGARMFAETSGQPFNLSPRVLHKHLHEQNVLASIDGPGRYTVRRDLGGKRSRRVLHLTVRQFDDGDAR